jgi:hypothetical protein
MDIHDGMKKVAEKSFWERPEGKTGLLFTAAAVGAGGYGLYKVLPFVIKLLENTLYASLLAGALAVITMPIWNSKVRTLCSYFFRSAMRKVTGFVVEIDPIGIITNYVEDLRKNQATMQKQIANLRGVMTRLATTIEEQKQQAAQSMRIAQVAKQQNNAKALRLQAKNAGRLEESNMTLSALHGKLERLYKYLLKLQDVADTMIQDMESEVAVETRKREAIRSAHGAFSSAMKILKGNGNAKDLYDLGMESLANDYAMKMGEIENFMQVSEGFIASVDLDNMAFEQEALEKLEEMEKNTDRLFSTSRSSMPSPIAQEEQNEVVSLFAARR